MNEIKQQLKWLSGSLDSITPVITEIKSAMTSKTRPLVATATLMEVRRMLTWHLLCQLYQIRMKSPQGKHQRRNPACLLAWQKWQTNRNKKARMYNAWINKIGKTTAKQMYEQRGTWLVDRSFPTLGNRLEVVLVKAEIFSSVRKDGRVIDCSYCGCPVHWKRYGTN